MAESNPFSRKATSKAYVLVGMPKLKEKELCIKGYLEGILGTDVATICIHPDIPDRVLFTMKQPIDIIKVLHGVSKHRLNGHTMRAEPAKLKSVVIVNYGDLLQQLTGAFVNEVCQRGISQYDENLANCVQIPQTAMVAVNFKDFEVMKTVLESGTHISLPRDGYKIQVESYYHNFHGYIPCKNKNLYQFLDETDKVTPQTTDPPGISPLNKRSQDIDGTLHESQRGTSRKIRLLNTTSEKRMHENLRLQYQPDLNVVESLPVRSGSKPSKEHAKKNIKAASGNKMQCSKEQSEKENLEKSVSSLIVGQLHQDTDLKSCRDGEEAEYFNPGSKKSFCLFEDRQNSEEISTSKPDEKSRPGTGSEFSLNCTLKKTEWMLLKDKIELKNNTIYYDETKEVLSYRGDNITQFLASFHEFQSHVIHEYLIMEGEDLSIFFSGTYAKEKLTHGLKEVQWCIENTSMHICGLDGTSVGQLRNRVEHIQNSFIKLSIENVWDSEYIKWLKHSLEKHFAVLIIFDAIKIVLSGVKDDVMIAQKRFVKSKEIRQPLEFKEDGSIRKKISFDFPESYYKLLNDHYKKTFVKNFRHVEYSVISKEDKIVLELDGNEENVDKVQKELHFLLSTIKVEVINVSKELGIEKCSLIIKMLSSQTDYSLSDAQKKFQLEHKCHIQNVLKKNSNSPISAVSSMSRAGNEMSSMTDEDRENQDITFRLNSILHLKLKNYGNITEEQSEVLVCFITDDKKLANTDSGKAFLSMDPKLQDIVSDLPFDSNVEFISYSCTGSTCKGIVFVILLRGLRPDQYFQTIRQILIPVNSHGFSSVSFPLGHGSVSKYDEEIIVKSFFSALRSFAYNVRRTALREITFLATNIEMYFRMRQEGEKYFRQSNPYTCGRRVNEDWIVVEDDVTGKNKDQQESLEIRIVHKNQHHLASTWKKKLEQVCISYMRPGIGGFLARWLDFGS